jgi:AbrB family looped-hinge helix DNA binding protein
MAHKAVTGPPKTYQLELGARGRLVLPAPVRKQVGLRPGDRLVLVVDESGEMRLASLRKQIEQCMGMFRHLARPKQRVSDELIAERRREADREGRR